MFIPLGPLPINRFQEVYLALQKGCAERIESIVKDYGTGWTARRELTRTFDTILKSINFQLPIRNELRLLVSRCFTIFFTHTETEKG